MATTIYKRLVEYWNRDDPVSMTMDVTDKRIETDEWRIRIYQDKKMMEFGPDCEFDCWQLTIRDVPPPLEMENSAVKTMQRMQ